MVAAYSLYGGRMYSLYVDVVVMSAGFVLSLSVCRTHTLRLSTYRDMYLSRYLF